MRAWMLAAGLGLAGCSGGQPDFLKHVEWSKRVTLDSAGPIDPASILLTVREDGRVFEKRRPLSPDELLSRIPEAKREGETGPHCTYAPVLLEVSARAPVESLHAALETLIGRGSCVNLSFLVATPAGPGALGLPVTSDA